MPSPHRRRRAAPPLAAALMLVPAIAPASPWTLGPPTPATGANFGFAVAGAGDVNGDGFADVIVGAPFDGPGRAYVFFGGPAADDLPDLVLTGEAAGDFFGISAAGAGDVNGDGYDDLIVGANRSNAGGGTAGRAYVFFGGPAPDAVADLVITGGAAFDHLGTAVAGAGDVNGDGYADVIVGANGNAARGTTTGQAYVYFGGPALDDVADLTFTGETSFNAFGIAVAGAGDVDGDGFADLIVGAYANDANGNDAGRAYVYYGGPGADDVADLVLTGVAPNDLFGWSVAGAGDVNGDGFADVIVGAALNDAGGAPRDDRGQAYVFFGGPGADATPDLTLTGAAPGDRFGRSVSGAGDLNHDGFADVVVGAPQNDAAGDDAGRAYVFFGGPGADAIPDVVWTGGQAGDQLGRAVGCGGDVDGDGVADVIVGAPLADAGAGRAYVFVRAATAAAPGTAGSRSALRGPWPNPARAEAEFALVLARPERVTVAVHDAAGRRVAVPIADEALPAGRTVRAWRPGGIPSGVYYLRAMIGDEVKAGTIVWIGGYAER